MLALQYSKHKKSAKYLLSAVFDIFKRKYSALLQPFAHDIIDHFGEQSCISDLFVRVGDGKNRSSDTKWLIER